MENVQYGRLIAVVAVTCTLVLVCMCGFFKAKNSTTGTGPQPVDISRSLFLNADSLAFYAERAYLDDDPKGLFVTGMAAHLRHYDPSYPDTLSTVPLKEADVMLWRAAQLGYQDAITYIRCLEANGCWHHSVPE